MGQLLTLLVSPKAAHSGQVEARLQSGSWLAFVFLLVLLVGCYFPVLNPNYAVSDDFYHLARSIRVQDWFSSLMTVTLLQGRPLDGLLLGLCLGNLHEIANFVY